jgi:hypothetical protein
MVTSWAGILRSCFAAVAVEELAAAGVTSRISGGNWGCVKGCKNSVKGARRQCKGRRCRNGACPREVGAQAGVHAAVHPPPVGVSAQRVILGLGYVSAYCTKLHTL